MKSKKEKKKYPKVSFVICTLNCKDYAERCFKSIRKQDYPQKKVEIVVVDSYSDDGTIEVAKKHGAKIILTKIRGYMEGKGMPKAIGVEKSKGEIIFTIDSDNALVEKDWIQKMVYPLMNNEEVDYCICRQKVVKSDPLVNQYLSLVGTDPFAIYSSVDPQISLGNLKLKDMGEYYIFENKKKDFYITGGYYIGIRAKTIKEIGGYVRDVDNAFKLAKKGQAIIAIPKKAHVHHLISKGFIDFFKKKVKWGRYYVNNPNLERDFKWSEGYFGKFGKLRFIYEVIRNLLFFPAFFVSLKMLIKRGEKAWILHAPMKFSTTIAYIYAYFKRK